MPGMYWQPRRLSPERSVSDAEVPVDQLKANAHPVLVLWDVDHTLIENSGVSKENYAKAFEIVTGRSANYPAQTDGRTDPEIVRNMLVVHGITPTDEYLVR